MLLPVVIDSSLTVRGSRSLASSRSDTEKNYALGKKHVILNCGFTVPRCYVDEAYKLFDEVVHLKFRLLKRVCLEGVVEENMR